jgi:hypothetical protein
LRFLFLELNQNGQLGTEIMAPSFRQCEREQIPLGDLSLTLRLDHSHCTFDVDMNSIYKERNKISFIEMKHVQLILNILKTM